MEQPGIAVGIRPLGERRRHGQPLGAVPGQEAEAAAQHQERFQHEAPGPVGPAQGRGTAHRGPGAATEVRHVREQVLQGDPPAVHKRGGGGQEQADDRQGRDNPYHKLFGRPVSQLLPGELLVSQALPRR